MSILVQKPKLWYNPPMIDKPITDPALIEKFKTMHEDGMTVFMLGEGQIRGAFFHGTRFVNKMRVQHNLGILESLALGHSSLCGALLIPTMKGRDRIIFRCDTQGPLVGFSVEAFSEGFVRGYLLEDPIRPDTPLETWYLKPLFGEGKISVIRFPEGAREPLTGIVEIKHKNIALDLSEYFLQSEQTVTGFNTGIQFDKEGRIIGAGGMYIQLMPGAEEALIEKAERAFAACPSIGQWFAEGGDREDVIFGLFRDCNPQVLIERKIDFYCPCSEENFRNKLFTLPEKEIADMYENGPEEIELYCHNCGSIYKYPKSILKEKINVY